MAELIAQLRAALETLTVWQFMAMNGANKVWKRLVGKLTRMAVWLTAALGNPDAAQLCTLAMTVRKVLLRVCMRAQITGWALSQRLALEQRLPEGQLPEIPVIAGYAYTRAP